MAFKKNQWCTISLKKPLNNLIVYTLSWRAAFCPRVLTFIYLFYCSSADLGKNSYSCNGDDEFESNDFGHFQSASDADFGHFQASQDDQVINDCDKLHSSCDEVHDEKSAKTKKVESVREIVLEANGVPDLEKEVGILVF